MIFHLIALAVILLGPLAFTGLPQFPARTAVGSRGGKIGGSFHAMRLRNLLAIVLLGIGSFQMIGDLARLNTLRGIGLASGISPLPKAFCSADGYEAFASSCHLEGTLGDGRRWSKPVDPEWCSRLGGPHNRRNAYGAALSDTPRLPDLLRKSLLSGILPQGSALRSELGVPGSIENLTVVIQARPGESEGPWKYSAKP